MEQRKWAWRGRMRLGEAGPVMKDLLIHPQESGINAKHQSNRAWLYRASPGKIFRNQLMPKPHPDFILCEGEAWVLVLFKDAARDSHVGPGLRITALDKRSAVFKDQIADTLVLWATQPLLQPTNPACIQNAVLTTCKQRTYCFSRRFSLQTQDRSVPTSTLDNEKPLKKFFVNIY